MNIRSFFPFLCFIFALLVQDPDPEAQINVDPQLGFIFLSFLPPSNPPGHLCRMCDVSLAVLWLGIDLMPIWIRTQLSMLMPILIRIRILLYVLHMLENQIKNFFHTVRSAMPVFIVLSFSLSIMFRFWNTEIFLLLVEPDTDHDPDTAK